MFQPPEPDEELEPKLWTKTYREGSAPVKDQMREIAEIKPPSIEHVREKYLKKLYEKLSQPLNEKKKDSPIDISELLKRNGF